MYQLVSKSAQPVELGIVTVWLGSHAVVVAGLNVSERCVDGCIRKNDHREPSTCAESDLDISKQEQALGAQGERRALVPLLFESPEEPGLALVPPVTGFAVRRNHL